MVLLDNLFSRKSKSKSASTKDAGPTNVPSDAQQSMERKNLRLEKRELLYAVVRESMVRVGMLSSSYKFKVLSLDSKGSQYLIMMDLPVDIANQIEQLNEIEEIIKENAQLRHKIEISAVYWRINQPAMNTGSSRPRVSDDVVTPVSDRDETAFKPANAPLMPGASRRFEPIRPDEVKAFKQALDKGVKSPPLKGKDVGQPAHNPNPGKDFASTEFHATEFEETQMQADDSDKNQPLSRTQYGDLI
jgi:hypothetical protein